MNSVASTLNFIIGRGRSGTWLLQSILNCHPQISASPEALFAMALRKKYSTKIDWNELDIDQFVDDLMHESRIAQWWKLDPIKLKSRLSGADHLQSYGDALLEVYRQYADQQGKAENSFLIDKNPSYTLSLHHLVDLYPNARFVCMVRDYRANILSFKQAGFDASAVGVLAHRWNSYNSRIIQFSQEHPDQTLLIQFEDFVQNNEPVLKQICNFLETEFDTKMLDFHQTDRKLESWQHNLNKPLQSTTIDKWKTGLSESDIALADHICAPLAAQFGYKASGIEISTSCKLKANFSALTAAAYDLAEQHFFDLPYAIQIKLLNRYRKQSGTS